MSNFTRHLQQTAVYWGTPQDTGRGEMSFADPVEVDCRWEDVGMIDENPAGIDVRVRSEVFLSQSVDEQGMLKLCTLDDLDSDELSDPVNAGAYKIARVDKIPNLRNTLTFYKAYVGTPWTGKL